MFLLVFLLVCWFCCLRLMMTQFCIQVALLMIWWMWFSWLSLNCEIHPYPSNNSFYSLARVGCVSRFHGCHELSYFDYDGFLLLKADDDISLFYRCGTAYAYISLFGGFLVLMVVIKTCKTSIPSNCSHWCSDGLGWTSLMLPWLSWSWFSTIYIWLLQANKHALICFSSIY
jgi:hypothetical protein